MKRLAIVLLCLMAPAMAGVPLIEDSGATFMPICRGGEVVGIRGFVPRPGGFEVSWSSKVCATGDA